MSLLIDLDAKTVSGPPDELSAACTVLLDRIWTMPDNPFLATEQDVEQRKVALSKRLADQLGIVADPNVTLDELDKAVGQVKACRQALAATSIESLSREKLETAVYVRMREIAATKPAKGPESPTEPYPETPTYLESKKAVEAQLKGRGLANFNLVPLNGIDWQKRWKGIMHERGKHAFLLCWDTPLKVRAQECRWNEIQKRVEYAGKPGTWPTELGKGLDPIHESKGVEWLAYV